MICQGGDTDANASIVGGLIGAAVGLTNIPEKYIKGILKFDGSKGVKRPDHLILSKNYPDLFNKLIECSEKIIV